MWRVRIPIYFKTNDPHRVIVVYPNAIDIPPLYPEAAAESCGRNCYPPRSRVSAVPAGQSKAEKDSATSHSAKPAGIGPDLIGGAKSKNRARTPPR